MACPEARSKKVAGDQAAERPVHERSRLPDLLVVKTQCALRQEHRTASQPILEDALCTEEDLNVGGQDPITVLGVLARFKIACDDNGVGEGATVWVSSFI